MYIIIEIQTNTNGALGVLTTTADNWRLSQKIYHEKLMYAAQSTLPRFAVALLDNSGNLLESRYYTTETEPEGEA